MTGAGSDATGSSASRGPALALGIAAVLAVAAFAWREVLTFGHLGWDTWPMIASARATSLGELLDGFREELMDGRYPIGRFYRPVANLSFALDYALWGTDALGYHLTDLAVLGATAALVALLARRMGLSTAGALLAAAVFALHPIHVEALPVSARRADALAVLFTLAALAAALGPPRGRAALVALASLAAAGSKESGVVVAALVPLAAALCVRPFDRRRAVACGAAAVAAVGAFVVARTIVLGGLGGHPDSSLVGGLARVPRIVDAYATGLVAPQPWTSDLGVVRALSVALALGLLGAVALAATTERAARFVALWFLAVAAITGVSGEFQPWYGAPFLPVLALALGTAAHAGLRAWRGGARARGGALLAATAVLLVTPLRFSPLVQDYPVWRTIDRDLAAFLADVEARTAGLRPGQACEVRRMPQQYPVAADAVGVTGAAGIAHYGVQAWAELELPDRPITVVDVRELGRVTPPGPDRVLVVVYPARAPRDGGAEGEP